MIPVTIGELRTLVTAEFATVVVDTEDGLYVVDTVEVVAGGTEVRLHCPGVTRWDDGCACDPADVDDPDTDELVDVLRGRGYGVTPPADAMPAAPTPPTPAGGHL